MPSKYLGFNHGQNHCYHIQKFEFQREKWLEQYLHKNRTSKFDFNWKLTQAKLITPLNLFS